MYQFWIHYQHDHCLQPLPLVHPAILLLQHMSMLNLYLPSFQWCGLYLHPPPFLYVEFDYICLKYNLNYKILSYKLNCYHNSQRKISTKHYIFKLVDKQIIEYRINIMSQHWNKFLMKNILATVSKPFIKHCIY